MNVVVLIGNLVRDPELRYTNSQMPICTATLAVNRPPSRNQAPDAPTADFIRVTIFGKQAETFQRYLTKGRKVAVEGRISTGSYQNQKGDTVYTTDVIVNRFDFVDGRGGGQGGFSPNAADQNYGGQNYGGQNNGGYGGGQNAGGGYAQQAPQQNSAPSQSGVPEGFSEIDEDDIPF